MKEYVHRYTTLIVNIFLQKHMDNNVHVLLESAF